MKIYFQSIFLILVFVILHLECSSQTNHNELEKFFIDWREFHSPNMINGVPDYSKTSMESRHQQLSDWQKKLSKFDTTGWSIQQQVDWYLVWAEMNGLDFAHRVKRPWERDPGFYVWFYSYPTDVPEREGPNIYGAIELPNYRWPLSEPDVEELTEKLKRAPEVFEQAMTNLTGNARDLWITGIRTIEAQSDELNNFAEKTKSEGRMSLSLTASQAAKASDKLAVWLKERSASKTGLSGTGKENYTWNLKKVHLLPYTWEEEVLIMKRELARTHSSLRLEENRNLNLPVLSRIDNKDDYDRLLNNAVNEYMEFLEKNKILPIKNYMDDALRAQIGDFYPSEGLRGFFDEVNYRDPILMRTQGYHWIDLARSRLEPK